MAIDILEKLPRIVGNRYLFPEKVPSNPIKVFRRIIKRAGIESSFKLHEIRHTVAS